MVQVPNTWREKMVNDAIEEMRRTRPPAAPAAPGGKPIRYDLTPQIDGTNNVFNLPITPDSKEQVHLYWNTGYVSPNDFSINGAQLITTGFVPSLGHTLYAVL